MTPYLLAPLIVAAALAVKPAQAQNRPPGDADAAAFEAEGPKRPVRIRAPHFKIFGKESRAVYTGGVVATRDDTRLTCRELTAYYDAQGEVRRLVCVGNVVATDGDKWARGQRATFDNVGAILEVTGNPEARQGPNLMRGSLVRFYVGTDVLEVTDADTKLESPRERRISPPGAR
ncbi:MAG TPA: LptA/OstA family protein [Myxococcaceae bacterium]|nr:LptA/OstA family protein [Myxococcaceae bacterium]